MARRRDYKAEYRRRQKRARTLGFRSYGQQRRAPRKIRSARDLARLPEAARESRNVALRALRLARDKGISVDAAASRADVPLSTVSWWAPEAIRRAGGRTLPTRGDRLLQMRPIILEGERGVDFVAVRGSRAVGRVEDAFDLQWGFIHAQVGASELRQLRGMRAGGLPIEADPEALRNIAAAGGVDVPEAYRAVLG